MLYLPYSIIASIVIFTLVSIYGMTEVHYTNALTAPAYHGPLAQAPYVVTPAYAGALEPP